MNKIILPRFVYTGPNTIKEIGNILHYARIHKGKVLLVCGPTATKDICLDIIKSEIEKENYEIENITVNSINMFIKNLQDKLFFIKKNKVNLIVGVGGGKPIDAAKLLASLSEKPFISIPTNVSHDGVSSPSISYILLLKLNQKYGLNFKMKCPTAIIADTRIIMKCPKESIKAGVGDLIAKFTAVKDWKLANLLKGEEYSEYAVSMSLMSAKIVEKNIDIISKFNEKAISIMMKTLIGSGIAISVAGSSRPASGSEHLFSHALDIIAEKEKFNPIMHGIQCGLGTIIMSKLHGLKWKKIREILRKVGAPTNCKEINLNKKYLIQALSIANQIRKDRYTILGETEISYEAAEKLLIETEII